MTAALREDAADEAQANLAEIEGARKDAELAMQRLVRLSPRLPLDRASHIDEAINRIEQGIDELILAERRN